MIKYFKSFKKLCELKYYNGSLVVSNYNVVVRGMQFMLFGNEVYAPTFTATGRSPDSRGTLAKYPW